MRNEHASLIAKRLRPYFDGLLREDGGTGVLYVRDDELGDRASCCTTGEVACFYVLDEALHGGDGKGVALRLMQDVRARQLPNGAFGQPYYVKKGEASTVDIAEIGAVANSLYHVYRATGSQEARDSLLASADYLLTQVAKENGGAVYKNPNAMEHDVLNGDVYAAHTWGRAYELTGKAVYLQKAVDVMTHVSARFGVHAPGWWPYIERWDGSIGMGNSVGYQGTIIAFAHTLKAVLPQELRERWSLIEIEAVDTMLRAMQDGPNDENEAPWWCRDWRNAWDLYLGLSRVPAHAGALAAVRDCLAGAERDLAELGIARFRPAVSQPDPERSPVTTTFRKAATFAGIFSYMILDANTETGA